MNGEIWGSKTISLYIPDQVNIQKARKQSYPKPLHINSLYQPIIYIPQ